jgi:CPA2 family monovalent cation:H+ antiporter-2
MLLAAVNPNLYGFVILGIIIVILGSILRYFKQPYIVAYILAGVLLGDFGFQIITDKELVNVMGDIGLILLLFFIGMEISLPDLVKNWKVAIMGTLLQVVGSVALVSIIGWLLDWQTNRIITMGFVISLSSSAVIIKLLQDSGEISTATGKNVLSVLLMQDILIVPMLIATNYLGGHIPSVEESILQIVGGVLIIGTIIWIWRKKEFKIPFNEQVEKDHELQVFVALVVCFGGAVITSFFGLSAALGAFVGGMVIHAARSTEWFHDSLHSLRVMFVALFFVSIGMLIDLNFLVENWKTVGLVIVTVYLSNHLINSLVLHYFGRNWKNSIYGGALLAQVGELSFVLVASALSSQIISDFTYQLTIIVISLTLLISPFWIAMTKRMIGRKKKVLKGGLE